MKELFIHATVEEDRHMRIISEETRKKMSESHKGKKRSPLTKEWKIKIGIANKGKIPWHKGKKNVYSEEVRKRWSEKLKGKLSHPFTEEMKIKNRLSHLGKKNPKISGPKNGGWKGNGVGYSGLHNWLRKHLGNANKCTKNIDHKSTKYVWANISGEYKRDLTDWHELCHKCNLTDGVKMNLRFKMGGYLNA